MPLEHIEFGAAAKSDVLNNNFMYLEQEAKSIKEIAGSSSFTKYDETKEFAKDEIITIIDESGKIIAYISQQDHNKGNALTDETYWKKSELGGGGLPVGSIFPHSATATYVPENSLPCDGTEYAQAQFKTLYNDWLVGKKLETCTYEEYQQDVTTNGACAKFGIDTANGKFKVPLIPDGYYIRKGKGTANKAGLPDHIHKYRLRQRQEYFPGPQNNAYYTTSEDFATGGSNTSKASASNPIYGASDTVETNAVAYRYFVVVATGSIKQSEMDWSQWASSLQGKANTDLANTAPKLADSFIGSITPDFDAGISFTPNRFVCPCAGVIMVYEFWNNGERYFKINGKDQMRDTTGGGSWLSAFFQIYVSKGTVIETDCKRIPIFYPLKGAK